ncbi:MAG: transcriptional regulator, LysR family [Polyangiaceae bacterium]|jgi:LysR family transcriptional activator of nhaA|nr:transcriptional regulator, LysR family [Polyangiaceae bacterium]
MEWINYHHLLYFWVVAREGGLVPAGKVLRLSHPTLIAQVRTLEEQLGEKLFVKVGRKLELTETGRVAYRYADEIFTLGREMVDAVKGRTVGQALRLEVGVADVVPKLIVRRLLQPALELEQPVRLVCLEDSFEKLLADLALHTLDIVIADAPVPQGSSVRVYSHFLGETGVSFFATKELASSRRRGFPKSLDGAPFLLPLQHLTLRRSLNTWFQRHDVAPHIVGEFEDSALLKAFGADGVGIFAAPSVVEREVMAQYDVQVVGRTEEVKERFYAISAERRLKHPAVVAVSDAAKHRLFAR